MPSTHFDLFGLPPELRSLVYSHYFAINTITDFGLLLNDSPESSLLAASKTVFKETIDIFKAGQQKHTRDQSELLTSISTHTKRRLHLSLHSVPGRYNEDITEIRRKRTAAIAAHSLTREGDVYCSGSRCKSHIEPCGCDVSKPLTPACSACWNFMRLALYLSAFPERKYCLVKNDSGGELNNAGEEVNRYIESHAFDPEAEFSCPRNFALDFFRLELDKQEFIDLRCNIRLKVVEDYYYRLEHLGTPFSEKNVYAFEQETISPELKAFEWFEEKYGGGELKWRDEYKQRAHRLQEKWREERSKVFELVPCDSAGPWDGSSVETER